MSLTVVEVQGFAWEKCFIPKEICVILKGKEYCYHIKQEECFRNLPEKQRKIINWASKKYHGMSWESGNITLSEAKMKIQKLTAHEIRVFTKGREKANFLSAFLGCEVVDLSKYSECPSVRKTDYKTDCGHHKTPNSHCAIDTARLLSAFVHGHSFFDGGLGQD